MEINSTCPDSTCSLRNSFGYCSVTACTHRNDYRIVGPVINCELCKYDLGDGDYLYNSRSSDHALLFEKVIVHYCPVCGRKLK